jgi:D-glycero-alpha-D-manno-heptose-7-phosphate kinase
MALDIERGDLANVFSYFDEAWDLKARLGALDGQLELREVYSTAKRYGALGGKILGAGGGGYFLFLAPPSQHTRLRQAFPRHDFQKVSIEEIGSRVEEIHYSGRFF